MDDMDLRQQTASVHEIEALIGAIEAFDGFPPLSEHKVRRLEGGDDAIVSTWGDGSALVAVAVGAFHGGDEPHWAVEVATSPVARTRELERAAIAAAVSVLPEGERSSLWANRKEQRDAAAMLGYRERRSVLRMEGPFPPDLGPTDVDLGTLADIADDELIEVHNRAFAGHPEASGLSPQRLDELRSMPWFDPDGVIVALIDGGLAGYCWTKLHPDGDGEVYLLAVDPQAHGKGLGEILATAGYSYLRRRGAKHPMLWVDGDNESAISLYRRIGLQPTHVNVEMVRE